MFAGIVTVQAQRKSALNRYIQGFVQDTADITRPQFIAYPILAYSPETNWEIGLSGLYLFYSKRDTLNRLSEIVAQGFYTIENQYGAFLEHALYSDKNKCFFWGISNTKVSRFLFMEQESMPSSPMNNWWKLSNLW